MECLSKISNAWHGLEYASTNKGVLSSLFRFFYYNKSKEFTRLLIHIDYFELTYLVPILFVLVSYKMILWENEVY